MIKALVSITLLGLMLNIQLAMPADLPDLKRTAGDIDPAVTQQNIHSTICVKGYTKTVRPPSYYTNKLKKAQISEYGYADTNPPAL